MSNINQQQENKATVVKGLLLASIIAGAVGFGIWRFWLTLLALKPEISTAIVAGIFTVLVSVFTLVWTNHKERTREIEQEHRKQVIPIYAEFVDYWFEMLTNEQVGKPPKTEVEILQFFIQFTSKIITWGSDNILREYLLFRSFADNINAPPVAEGVSPEEAARQRNIGLMISFERLLYAMRADLGHKNEGLKPTDLFSLFINDMEEFTTPISPILPQK